MLIIDRFEGKFAVCEQDGGKMVNIDRSRLPEEAREGDVLTSDGNGFAVDHKETELRRKRIRERMDRLFEN